MAIIEISKRFLLKMTSASIKQFRIQSTNVVSTVSGVPRVPTIPQCPYGGHTEIKESATQQPSIHSNTGKSVKPNADPVLRSGQAVNSTDVKIEKSVKSYKNIPSPKGLPIIGTTWDIISSGSLSRFHLYCHKRHQQLGPIYKEKVGVLEAVFISDNALVHKVYADERSNPRHLVPEAWTIYNENTGNKRGLFFMEGNEWQKHRKILNQVFFRSFQAETNGDKFNEIITDLMSRWETISKQNNGELPDLEKELYRWSIESLGVMVFGKRIGCLNDDSDRIQTFVSCTQQIFTESANMTLISPKLAYGLQLPVWKRFEGAVNTALEIASSLVKETMEEIKLKKETNQPTDGILAQLMEADSGIDEADLVRIITDLVLAAADTTSHAVQWALYLLAKHPEWQEKIAKEIRQVVPNGQIITPKHLEKLRTIKALTKETLRLYPVAPLLTRILTEDREIGGYEIPKDTLILMSLYTSGRDPKCFKDPEVFNPGRWIRDEFRKNGVVPTHASLPFGIGPRSCVGRLAAELQMHLLLSRIISSFELNGINLDNIEMILRMISTPSERVRLCLDKRF